MSHDNELGEMAQTKSYLGTPKQIICKFVMFAVFFSLNHGCVTGVLAYVQEFFTDVGPTSVAVLYGLYTGTALLLAAIIVDWATYKYALLGGLTLYCLYVACYAVGGGFPEVRTPVILTGAAIGGFSAGFLWTAQGPYFKAFSEQYALATNSPQEKVTGLFAGIFAFCYLGCEVLLKIAAKPAFEGDDISLQSTGVVGLFSGYAVVSIVSCIGIMFVPEIPVPTASAKTPWYKKVVSVLKLLVTNPRVILLGPAQCSFGFCVELMGLYVAVEVAKCSGDFGVDVMPYIPWMVTSIPALAAILQVPSGLLVKSLGNKAVVTMMCLGQAAFIAMGAICVFVSRDTLASWGVSIIVIFILQGIGRAAYEGANRATYANMFKKEDSSAAFASMTLFGGVASTIAYATFQNFLVPESTNTSTCIYAGKDVPNYDGVVMGWICLITGIVGIVFYILALIVDAKCKPKDEDDNSSQMPEACVEDGSRERKSSFEKM